MFENIIKEMNRFSIKDIENLTGVKAHTIRIWEQRYGILQPKRTPTNIRYYDALDLKLALRIALLNKFGYKISSIHKMDEHSMNQLIDKISDEDFKLHLLVNELLECTLSMDMDHFEELMSMYLKKNGLELTVESLIFEFLEKIGLMWLTDRIFPAQEHLISNVIYRKLALAIENLPPKPQGQKTSVLLFLPEGEIHDISLLYAYYILLKYGKDPIYLGPNSPIKEVEFVYQAKKPDYLYTHLTSVAEDFDGKKYLQKLCITFPDAQIITSGNMIKSLKTNQFPNVKFLYNLAEAKELFKTI
ncbi:MAG: MerR family transcriptional regulator [Flavipsychrobacter sp.]